MTKKTAEAAASILNRITLLERQINAVGRASVIRLQGADGENMLVIYASEDRETEIINAVQTRLLALLKMDTEELENLTDKS